ncbi:MAG: zinc ribbon domain-containing protein [Lachnospiraceae bacterium]|nr:zinc ribbon domain-containing protein [Lachnospiraceae bacterium]
MYCVNCGKEIPEGVKFCPVCGGEQQNVNNAIPKQGEPKSSQNSDKPIKQKKKSKVGIIAVIIGIVIVIYIGSLISSGSKRIDLYDIAHMSETDVARKYQLDESASLDGINVYKIDDHHASVTFYTGDTKSVSVQLENYRDEYQYKNHRMAGHALFETIEEFDKDTRFKKAFEWDNAMFYDDLNYDDAWMHLYLNEEGKIYNMVYDIIPGSDKEMQEISNSLNNKDDLKEEPSNSAPEEVTEETDTEDSLFDDGKNLSNDNTGDTDNKDVHLTNKSGSMKFTAWDEEEEIILTLNYDTGDFELTQILYDSSGNIEATYPSSGEFQETADGLGTLNIDGGDSYDYEITYNSDHYEISINYPGREMYLMEAEWAYNNVG